MVKIWTEPPAKAEVEAVIGEYFRLLRAGKIPEAEQFVDHAPVPHVLKALWSESAGADAPDDSRLAAGEWERDLSWLSELDLGEFRWGYTDTSFIVDITYRAKVIEVGLGFHVKDVDAGWVISGPATYW